MALMHLLQWLLILSSPFTVGGIALAAQTWFVSRYDRAATTKEVTQ